MNSVHICPVCNGLGTVQAGFYDPDASSTDAARETCRSCKGRGVIVVRGASYPPHIQARSITIKAGPWGESDASGGPAADLPSTVEG